MASVVGFLPITSKRWYDTHTHAHTATQTHTHTHTHTLLHKHTLLTHMSHSLIVVGVVSKSNPCTTLVIDHSAGILLLSLSLSLSRSLSLIVCLFCAFCYCSMAFTTYYQTLFSTIVLNPKNAQHQPNKHLVQHQPPEHCLFVCFLLARCVCHASLLWFTAWRPRACSVNLANQSAACSH
jgi:hypothetical protein